MTELDLYKFIIENDPEWHYTNDKKDVILFIGLYIIDDFHKLLEGSHIFDENGIYCHMKDGYFCFEMEEICAHFNIELYKIFDPFNEH